MNHYAPSETPFSANVVFEPKASRDLGGTGNDRILTPQSRTDIQTCTFKNAVYAVVAKNIVQYVGCTANGLSSRFIKGIDRGYDEGYRWQAAYDAYTLYAWELPEDRELGFVEAVEADVSMLIRASTGHWPVDLAKLSPQHFLRASGYFVQSGRWAMEIVNWLVHNQKIAMLDAEQRVLAAIAAAHLG